MTIIEALKLSKVTGRTFMRVRGGGGFVRYDPDFAYMFDSNDLLANDWEDVETGIPELTGGKYGTAEP